METQVFDSEGGMCYKPGSLAIVAEQATMLTVTYEHKN